MVEFIVEHRLALCVLLGIITGIPIIWNRREKLGITKKWQAVPVSIVFQLTSVVTTTLFARFEGLLFPASDRKLAMYGIFFLTTPAIMLFAKLFKRDGLKALDVLAVYGSVAMMFMRLDCSFAHCCDGYAIAGTSFYWPTAQAELVFFLIMYFVLLKREKQGASKGTQYFLVMASYAVFRFVIEWLRVTPWNTLLHPGHLWSVISFIIGISVYYELMKKSEDPHPLGRRGK